MPYQTASQIVALKSPDLASDSRLSDFIGLAKEQLSATNFGTKYEYAVALLVLHWMTLDAQGGGSDSSSGSGVVGGIKSEKEGDLARSFGNLGSGSGAKAGNAYYNSTAFGAEFISLRRRKFLLPRNRFVT
jgi:hypothetical protein